MSKSSVPQYHDPKTRASDPGSVTIDDAKLKLLSPIFYGFWGFFRRDELARLKEQARLGDSRAALVMSLDPLLVAAYTDELDCVAMLHFPSSLVATYKLQVNTPLLTINVYPRGPRVAHDLTCGDKQLGRYQNMWPVIAEFVSSDYARIEARKKTIAQAEWKRCHQMGTTYLKDRPGVYRNGAPHESLHPHNRRWNY